jgi:hypothetical protein
MQHYSQRSYPNVMLGTSSDPISRDGCALIALCNLCGSDPVATNDLFNSGGDYADGELVKWAACATALGMTYLGDDSRPSVYPCIASTDHYAASGYPTHYFVVKDPSTIIDSLDGQEKPVSTYAITGVRNFSLNQPGNQDDMTFDLIQVTGDPTVFMRVWPVVGNDSVLIPIPSADQAALYFGADWASKVTQVSSLSGQGEDIRQTVNDLSKKASDAQSAMMESAAELSKANEELSAMNDRPPTGIQASPEGATVGSQAAYAGGTSSAVTPGWKTSEFWGTLLVHLYAGIAVVAGLTLTGNHYADAAIAAAGVIVAWLNQHGYNANRTELKSLSSAS